MRRDGVSTGRKVQLQEVRDDLFDVSCEGGEAVRACLAEVDVVFKDGIDIEVLILSIVALPDHRGAGDDWKRPAIGDRFIVAGRGEDWELIPVAGHRFPVGFQYRKAQSTQRRGAFLPVARPNRVVYRWAPGEKWKRVDLDPAELVHLAPEPLPGPWRDHSSWNGRLSLLRTFLHLSQEKGGQD